MLGNRPKWRERCLQILTFTLFSSFLLMYKNAEPYSLHTNMAEHWSPDRWDSPRDEINIGTVSQHSPSTVSQHSPTSVSQHSPASVNQHSPASVSQHSPASVSQHSPASVSQHSPASVSQHSPASVSQHSPASVSQHSPASVSQHSQASVSLHINQAVDNSGQEKQKIFNHLNEIGFTGEDGYNGKINRESYKDAGDAFNKDEDKFEEIMSVYLEARGRNLTNTQIARDLFSTEFPNIDYKPELPHSFPFITYTTFMAWADWIFTRYTPVYNFSLFGFAQGGITGWERMIKIGQKGRRMKDGDVIYVSGDELRYFAWEVAPALRTKYILVTHCTDNAVPEDRKSLQLLDDDLLIRWFALNPRLSHPKLEPLPIGIKRQFHPDGGGELDMWEALMEHQLIQNRQNTEESRKNLLYVNFTPRHENYDNSTFGQLRRVLYKTMSNQSFVTMPGGRGSYTKMSVSEYLTDITHSQYVLSPPGVGEDCYRTWESILLGAVPVVLQSRGMNSLWDQTPVLMVSDLLKISEEDLKNYKERRGRGRRDIALAPYWFNKINSYRNK